MSTYAERAWRDLSKGLWEARTHGLGKDVVMRPPSGDEEVLQPTSKPEKAIKRKMALDSEGQKPKKRAARKPKASMLHREAFFQSRVELSRYEAEVRRLTEERDALKILSEQREGEVKGLRTEMEASRKEQAELFDEIRGRGVEEEHGPPRLKEGDCLNSTLSSANSDRERLATELAAAKTEVEQTTANADAMVAVYRSDAEAAQIRAKGVVEAAQARANWVSNHAKFEIEKAMELEAEARVLAFPDDDDTGSANISESEEGLEGEDAAPGED
ncbi:uncharacterized protein [Nicotiana tomentosiformis]|uniref:uncharacterized protein n=1 Tax=Nicotiana tomentosiformis TaxID=4098 RepID=UPI00388CC017